MPDRPSSTRPPSGVRRLLIAMAVAVLGTLSAWLLEPVASFAGAGAAAPTSAEGATVNPGLLRPGSGYYNPRVSARVRAVQIRLAALGYSIGRIDGRLGERTERAVRRFQTDRGLPRDGIVGPRTLAALSTATAASSPQASARSPAAPSASSSQEPLPPSSPPTRRSTSLPSPPGSRPAVRQRENERAVHRGRTSQPPAWPLILGLLVLACLLGAGWYTRRRLVRGHEELRPQADQTGDVAAAFNLGVVLEQHGGLAGAEAAYRRADQRGHAAAASNLGVMLEERGDLAEAEAAYQRADDRGDPNGAFNLGVLLEQRGLISAAEAAYRHADERGHAEVADMARAALIELGLGVSNIGVDGTGVAS